MPEYRMGGFMRAEPRPTAYTCMPDESDETSIRRPMSFCGALLDVEYGR